MVRYLALLASGAFAKHNQTKLHSKPTQCVIPSFWCSSLRQLLDGGAIISHASGFNSLYTNLLLYHCSLLYHRPQCQPQTPSLTPPRRRKTMT